MKMYKEILEQFEYISKSAGSPVDYTQGGGGNTSVKLDDTLMAVKASGFKLKQITPAEGYVVVNYKKIKDYYENVDLNSDTDFEKESAEFVKKNIVEFDLYGIKYMRECNL
jgi:rhamnose utilization protein RhaD (predicted bifunctional aldolase and dehydrogenase)